MGSSIREFKSDENIFKYIRKEMSENDIVPSELIYEINEKEK